MLVNDFDFEGKLLIVIDFIIVFNGELVVKSNGIFEYILDINFVSIESFSYIISDGDGGIDSVNVMIIFNKILELVNNIGIVVKKGLDR